MLLGFFVNDVTLLGVGDQGIYDDIAIIKTRHKHVKLY